MSKSTHLAPSYIPARQWAASLIALVLGLRRSSTRDGETIWRSLRPEPETHGAGHIPPSGPFLLIANHYNGPGVWVGLSAALLAALVGRMRPHVPFRALGIAAYEDFRLFGQLPIPDGLTRALFSRFYSVYGMIPMGRAGAEPVTRAAGVRQILTSLHEGAIVLAFPEGGNVPCFAMRELRPGVGDLLRLITRARVPIVPAAVYQDRSRFTITVGEPLALDPTTSSQTVETIAGKAIAALLPPRLRGPYGTYQATAPAVEA